MSRPDSPGQRIDAIGQGAAARRIADDAVTAIEVDPSLCIAAIQFDKACFDHGRPQGAIAPTVIVDHAAALFSDIATNIILRDRNRLLDWIGLSLTSLLYIGWTVERYREISGFWAVANRISDSIWLLLTQRTDRREEIATVKFVLVDIRRMRAAIRSV